MKNDRKNKRITPGPGPGDPNLINNAFYAVTERKKNEPKLRTNGNGKLRKKRKTMY